MVAVNHLLPLFNICFWTKTFQKTLWTNWSVRMDCALRTEFDRSRPMQQTGELSNAWRLNSGVNRGTIKHSEFKQSLSCGSDKWLSHLVYIGIVRTCLKGLMPVSPLIYHYVISVPPSYTSFRQFFFVQEVLPTVVFNINIPYIIMLFQKKI